MENGGLDRPILPSITGIGPWMLDGLQKLVSLATPKMIAGAAAVVVH